MDKIITIKIQLSSLIILSTVLIGFIIFSAVFMKMIAESKKETAAMMWRIDDALIKCERQLKTQ